MEQILKIQRENKKTFDSKRKEAITYDIGDQVAIKRTQFGSGLKLKKKNFGPYQITKIKGNDRYEVNKIGIHEGPHKTSSSAENMSPWKKYNQTRMVSMMRSIQNTSSILKTTGRKLIIVEGKHWVGKKHIFGIFCEI